MKNPLTLCLVLRGSTLALPGRAEDSLPSANEERQLIALPPPGRGPALSATVTAKGGVLSGDRRSDLSGFTFELHRSGKPGFTPDKTTRLGSLTRFDYLDPASPRGEQHDALMADGHRRSLVRASVTLARYSQTSDADASGELTDTPQLNSFDRFPP